MNINTRIVKTLNSAYYSHVSDYAKYINYSNSEELSFKEYWNNLVMDKDFKDYTHRERRILQYIYRRNTPLELVEEANCLSLVNFDINYTKSNYKLTPVEHTFITNKLLNNIITTDIEIIKNKIKDVDHVITIHLFRIKASNGKISPTTSGIHKDGMSFIFMHFINSKNIYPVISQIHQDETLKKPLAIINLNKFLETLIVNDEIVFHSASAVQQLIQKQDAYRDLLLITFRPVDIS